MADPAIFTGESGEKKSGIEGKWAAFSAIGTFVLYFFGYLTLRFHLTAFGVTTDLAVLDERYLFAGAQFLVYLASAIPVLVLVGLIPAGLLYLTRRFWWALFEKLADRPPAALLIAVLLSVVLIQFVIRQCFNFTNLLLRSTLPDPWWMAHWILLDPDGGFQMLYFSFLVAGCLATFGLWCLARRRQSSWSAGSVLVAALVAIQFLFLPVTFGVLIVDKEVPRVMGSKGEAAWRIWEGKEGVVFLTLGPGQERTLTTIDKKEIKKTEITCYDQILNVLFERKP